MKIYTTKDYGQFKTVIGNRALSRANLKKITGSIAEKNMLDVVPLVVNEKMEIIDGQHRFQIAKENGFPIHYVVLEGGSLADVHSLNNISRKWESSDYVKSYAIQSISAYRRLLRFMEETGTPVTVAMYLLKNKGGGHVMNQVKKGILELSEEEVEKGLKAFSDYQIIQEHFTGLQGAAIALIRAVLTVTNAGQVERLKKALSDRNIEMPFQTSYTNYLREFETVLNWKVRTEDGLVRLF